MKKYNRNIQSVVLKDILNNYVHAAARGTLSLRLVSIFVTAVAFIAGRQAKAENGVLRDGAGARAMALGGASVASPDQPLEAMYSNPAGLAFATGTDLQVGGIGGVLNGNFANAANQNSAMRTSIGALPEAAYVYHFNTAPVSLGFGIIPDAVAAPNWMFMDAPGGTLGNTSYDLQKNFAEFLAVRASAGASWKISDTFSVGADLGAEYNRNQLIAPYTFQAFPPLKGFKTLLDLQTDGWGVNGTVGLVWHPAEKISVGLSYRSMTYFDTTGHASANAGVQLQNLGLGAVDPALDYDAAVGTKLPQSVSAGVSWQALDDLRLIGQLDWVNWSGAFDHLPIQLKNGSNPAVNGLVGSSFRDDVPLNWKNTFVIHTGVEYAVTKDFLARFGYSFGQNPVPSSSITPMSAAILENTLTCGLEWHHDRWSIAGAYQYDLPSTVNVGTSSLASGEFSNSSTTISAHTFALTLGFKL